jgi:hypothetical protein
MGFVSGRTYNLTSLTIMIANATAFLVYNIVVAISENSSKYNTIYDENAARNDSSNSYATYGIIFSIVVAVFHSAILSSVYVRHLKMMKWLVKIKTIVYFKTVLLISVFTFIVCKYASEYAYIICIAWIWVVMEGGAVVIPLWLHKKKLMAKDALNPFTPGGVNQALGPGGVATLVTPTKLVSSKDIPWNGPPPIEEVV